ncbi:hypothetical protein [Henriciella marina]|uniref:GNAT family N-acetyltransferase n=1 Tax=Henriciella marina TaxID=453851 RepID=A0ABT4LRE1_9PROT|nr:hypothetical protein [Henriciella marina]MCZ4296881.1 hypothetical protein [Henriciella marina]
MQTFSQSDLDEIDKLWRSVPADHMWAGWSAAGAEPEEVWLYRTRAHWRKFPLRKTDDGFALFDEKDRPVAEAASLDDLLTAVESIPALAASEAARG